LLHCFGRSSLISAGIDIVSGMQLKDGPNHHIATTNRLDLPFPVAEGV
jgi:hypothetical protein